VGKLLILLMIIGAALVAAGLFGLGYCIRVGYRIRGAGLPPEAVHAQLHRLLAINLGSVAAAALGLALLLAGLLL
jgi:hypothetical protein